MALTSAEKMQAYRQKLKERKQRLDDIGLTEISLIISKDELFKIKNMAKMMQVNEAKLLYSVTRQSIKDLSQRHDDVLTTRYKEQERLRQNWIDSNPELFKELMNSVEVE